MSKAGFKADTDKCIGCGLCLKVCPGNMVGGDVLRLVDGHPVMTDQNNFGWLGCWRCMHCFSACPEGAISILGSTPDDGSEKPSEKTADDLYKLMKYRRTSRDFRRDEVDPETIDRILDAVSAVPTGGNNNRLEFSVIYTRDAMRRLYRAVYGGQQLDFLSDGDEDDLSELRIYDAPHLFIAHTKVGDRFRDGDFVEISMATAYFELLANAMGLGTVISTYSAELLSKNEEAMRLLQIPKDHRFMTVVGFGYPKYRYARGIRKTRPIHRIK